MGSAITIATCGRTPFLDSPTRVLKIYVSFVYYRIGRPKRAFFICYSSWLKLGQSLWRWVEFWRAYVSPSVSGSDVGFSLAWFESAQPTFSFLGPVTRLDWLTQNSTAL